jgi:parallel beta-helix repeat protein
VLRNQFSGNGYVRPAGTDPNSGIVLLLGTDNLIEDNIVTGNVTGVRINPASTGNVFRGNTIVGNPPILVSNNVPENAASGLDIFNLAATTANTFENNLCITAMNAPCTTVRPTDVAIPLARSVAFDTSRVRSGGSFNASFSGDNLTSATYFDLRLRAPGATSDLDVWNWQQGPSASHTVPQGTALGDWTITGVRAHQQSNDHTGPFGAVQATVSVFSTPFF